MSVEDTLEKILRKYAEALKPDIMVNGPSLPSDLNELLADHPENLELVKNNYIRIWEGLTEGRPDLLFIGSTIIGCHIANYEANELRTRDADGAADLKGRGPSFTAFPSNHDAAVRASEPQCASPEGSPDGVHWSVIEGVWPSHYPAVLTDPANLYMPDIHIAHVRAQASAPVSSDNDILFCRARPTRKTNLIASMMRERLKTPTGSNNFEAIWEAAHRRHSLKYLHLQADMANNEKDSTAMAQHGKTVWDLCSDASLNQLFNNINRPKEDTMQTSTRNQIALELGPKIRQHHLRNNNEVVVNGTFHSMADFTGNEVTVIDATENELIECGLKDTFLEIQAPNAELGRPYMFRLVQLGEKIPVQCNNLSNALIKFCQLPDIGRLIAVANQQPPLLPVCSKYMVQNHYGKILKMKDHSFIKGVYLGLTALGNLVWVDEGSLTDPKECLTADEITKLNAHVLENAPEHYDAEFIQRVKRGYGWGPLSHGNSFETELLVVLDDELFAINKETGVIEHWLEDATTELKAAVSAQHGWTDASVPEDVLLDHLATLDDNDKVAKFHYSHVTKDSDGDRTCDHGVIFTMLPAHPMYSYYRKLAEELEGDE